MLSTFLPVFITNYWISALAILVTVSFLYLSQWAILTNRRIRELADVENIYTELYEEEEKLIKNENNELKKMINELRNNDIEDISSYYMNIIKCKDINIYDSVKFTHIVADTVKRQIAKMPYQDFSITRDNIIKYFSDSLNSLEIILSNIYGTEIRASIKLLVSTDKLKTYSRGKNNIKSRGGKVKVISKDRKEISINDNYAYKLIVLDQLQYFAESDLSNLKNKMGDRDVFYCEYGKKYNEIFNSTIIMPIRIPVYENGREDGFKILGILCIDSLDILSEWDGLDGQGDDVVNTTGYHIIACYADNLYILIKRFCDAMENK